jgi:CheY-like chemotaxis protein
MVAKTVLVVEDDPSVRIVAEEMFVAAGFEVESVQRADHALDIVAQRETMTCDSRAYDVCFRRAYLNRSAWVPVRARMIVAFDLGEKQPVRLDVAIAVSALISKWHKLQ